MSYSLRQHFHSAVACPVIRQRYMVLSGRRKLVADDTPHLWYRGFTATAKEGNRGGRGNNEASRESTGPKRSDKRERGPEREEGHSKGDYAKEAPLQGREFGKKKSPPSQSSIQTNRRYVDIELKERGRYDWESIGIVGITGIVLCGAGVGLCRMYHSLKEFRSSPFWPLNFGKLPNRSHDGPDIAVVHHEDIETAPKKTKASPPFQKKSNETVEAVPMKPKLHEKTQER